MSIAEEWATRVDLAAACRLVAHLNWDPLCSTRISARIPGRAQHFLINPCDLLLDEMRASNLVLIDAGGHALDKQPRTFDPASFMMHLAIHAAREDAACVMHVQPLDGVAVSSQRGGLLPLSQHSIFVLQTLAYHQQSAATAPPDHGSRVGADLKEKNCLMLRNRGLLTCGPSVAEAFQWMYMFQAACMMQVRAQSGGNALIPIDQNVIDTAGEQSRAGQNGMSAEQLIWPGLLRRLDRVDSSYRE